MRRSRIPVLVFAAAVAAAGALVAQGFGEQPPAGGGRGQGRGGGRAGWVTIKDGEECPPGTTEARHLQCAPPASSAPNILDYRPRSTVVAESHLVPKARYPVVDVHTHGTSAYVNNPDRIKEMDPRSLPVL